MCGGRGGRGAYICWGTGGVESFLCGVSENLDINVLLTLCVTFAVVSFPKAWRRVVQWRWLSSKSRGYMDDVTHGMMDDARMDGVMDLVGFALKVICSKARGRVGGSRRTSFKQVQKTMTLCVRWRCRNAKTMTLCGSAWSRHVVIA